MKFEIKNRWSGGIQFTAEIECDENAKFGFKVGLAVKWAIENKADLRSADLRSADLRSADLRSADLRSADLQSANLQYANLQYANLRYADLRSANLQYANLQYANLRSADLQSADLQSADLQYANLRYADLRSADLQSADLRSADLRSADLRSADLRSADLQSAANAELAIAKTRVVPEEGDVIGWKKCQGEVIVKLKIPAHAKRSNAFGRKCRAEMAEVLEVFGAHEAVSGHDSSVIYRKGEMVHCDHWEEDFTVECAGGIHFFITRKEAEEY